MFKGNVYNNHQKSLLQIQKRFEEYYKKYFSDVKPPPKVEKREFGFFSFKERIMLRHKAFRNIEDFKSFVRKKAPSDVFYSGAYYERPENVMSKKGWLGADLIFDIDADHILTPCNKTHDVWTCNNCNLAGRGITPEICPACSGKRFYEKTWLCETCLESAKAEMIKLIDFLLKDFGLSSKKMKLFFSGHRGYHLHIECGEVSSLNQLVRKEIVDYLLGIGLDTKFHGLSFKRKTLVGPDLKDLGWRGRLAMGTYDFLLTASREELDKMKLNKRIINLLINRREALLDTWIKRGPWGTIQGISIKSWNRLALKGAERQSVKIDAAVTTDIHRLIRFPYTLHGKTGFVKTEMLLSDIEKFDPFKSAIAFTKGTIRVFVSDSPKFRILNKTYGPYKNQKVDLPTAGALYLLCKGAANWIEEV